MSHISAALEGVAEARLQVLLGLPLMPWSRRGLRGKRGQIYLRQTLTEVVNDRIGRGGEDFLSKLVRVLEEKFPAEEAHALAVDNARLYGEARDWATGPAVSA